MSASKSTSKTARTQERRRVYNKSVRKQTRTVVRKARESVASGDPAKAQNATVAAVSTLDRAVSKGVVHKNTAARLKSRLVRRMQGLESGKSES